MSYTFTQTELGAGNIQLDVLWSVNAQQYKLQSNLQFTQLLRTIFDVADYLATSAVPDYRLLRPAPATNDTLENVSAGKLAGSALTIGTKNVAIGSNALNACLNGTANTGIGDSAYRGQTGGSNNVAIGQRALSGNGVSTGGAGNIGIGYQAGTGVTTGSGNVFVGRDTGFDVGAASNNTGIGSNALQLVKGNVNSALGFGAGLAINSGTNNVCLGDNAGTTINTGSNNTMVGSSANVDSFARSLCVSIGKGATSPAVDGSLAIGGTAANAMANLNVATAGGAAVGEYLNIYLNGVQRKIALLLP